jgi:hypothetical protein
MNSISLSDIQRNLHKLNDFDIVELVDKKRKKVKGYFLDSSYKEFVEKLIEDKKMSKLELLKISGIIDSNNTTTKESLRDERLAKYE